MVSKVGGRFNFRFFVFKTMRKVYKKRCNIKKVFWDFWTNIWVSWTIIGDFWKKILPFAVCSADLNRITLTTICREKVEKFRERKRRGKKVVVIFHIINVSIP